MNPNKQAGVAISVYNKIDFKTKFIERDRKEYCTPIKGKIHQDDFNLIPGFQLETASGMNYSPDMEGTPVRSSFCLV